MPKHYINLRLNGNAPMGSAHLAVFFLSFVVVCLFPIVVIYLLVCVHLCCAYFPCMFVFLSFSSLRHQKVKCQWG